MKERIQKVLAAAGIASRRSIEEMVKQGRIEVNGKTMVDLPIMVDVAKDKIAIDGELLKLRKPTDDQLWYLMLNKPRHYVCSTTSQGVQKRVLDLLPPEFSVRVYPVGRLDLDSTGLLLLTNDGELTQKLTHPRFGVAKTYRATVEGKVAGEAMSELEKGVFLIDRDTGKAYKTQRCVIKVIERSNHKTVIDITLKEGRNRQIRRMFARVGFKVRDLARTNFGPIKLEKLPIGSVRKLTPAEVKSLHAAVDPEKVARRQAKFAAEKGRKKQTATGSLGDAPALGQESSSGAITSKDVPPQRSRLNQPRKTKLGGQQASSRKAPPGKSWISAKARRASPRLPEG